MTRIAVNKSIGLLSDIKPRKERDLAACEEVRRNSDQSIRGKKDGSGCKNRLERYVTVPSYVSSYSDKNAQSR